MVGIVRIYCTVPDGARRYQRAKTRLKPLKSSIWQCTLPREGRGIIFRKKTFIGFIKQSTSSHARLNVPTLVQVAAMAIILIRGLDIADDYEYPRHTWDGRVYSSQRCGRGLNPLVFLLVSLVRVLC